MFGFGKARRLAREMEALESRLSETEMSHARLKKRLEATEENLKKAEAKVLAAATAEKERPVLNAEVGTGKKGKFRFVIRDDKGTCIAISNPQGYESQAVCEDNVAMLSNARLETQVKE